MCQLFLDGALFLTEIYLFIYLLLEKTCGTRPAVKPPLSGTLHTERGQNITFLMSNRLVFLVSIMVAFHIFNFIVCL